MSTGAPTILAGVCGPQVVLNALGKLSPPQIVYVVLIVLASGLAVSRMIGGTLRVRDLVAPLAAAVLIGVLVFTL